MKIVTKIEYGAFTLLMLQVVLGIIWVFELADIPWWVAFLPIEIPFLFIVIVGIVSSLAWYLTSDEAEKDAANQSAAPDSSSETFDK